MNALARQVALSTALSVGALIMAATPALAKTHHHKHHVTHHARHPVKASGSTIIRVAQNHLANLGYYHGAIDGKMGPQTKAAIKNFQREHGLKVDGVLGSHTNRALANADHHVVLGTHSFETHDVVNNASAENAVSQDFATSLNGGTKAISSRFARVDVAESGVGAEKRYSVNLNGQPVLTADGQPSVIGISPTYDLGQEDAIIFTTYSPSNINCMYKNHVMALSNSGSQILDIDNCTRGYQARVNEGSLYISFPEYDDNRALGATWRLESMTLERL